MFITIRLILQIICLFTIFCSVLMYWHFTFRTARVRPLDRWNETSDVVCAVANLLWRTGSDASVSVSSTLSFPRPLHDVASIVRLNSKSQSFFGVFFLLLFSTSYKPEIVLIIYISILFDRIYIIRINGVRKDIRKTYNRNTAFRCKYMAKMDFTFCPKLPSPSLLIIFLNIHTYRWGKFKIS